MLKSNFVMVALLFFMSGSVFAQPAGGGTEAYLGALVPTCEVDEARIANGKRLDSATKGASDAIRDHASEKASKASCFEQLRKIASYINFKIPSAIFNEGLIDRIKDRACKEAVRAIERTVARNRIALESPYGMYGIEVGASGNESGVTVSDSGPALENVEELIIKSTGDIVNNAGKDAAEDLDEAAGIGDLNRDAKSKKREAEGEVDDGFDDVRDGVNAI